MVKQRTSFVALVVLLVINAQLALSEDGEFDPVSAALFASADGVTPGGTLWLGVLFKMEPGWHVYWKNPGDAGLPSRLNISAPKYLTVGDLQWPTPRKFDQAVGLVGYGYEKEVLLALPLAASSAAVSGDTAIEVVASWLACSMKLCVPGKKTFSYNVTVGKSPGPQNENLFTPWRASLPEEISGNSVGVKVSTAGKLNNGRGLFTITLNWPGQRPALVEWIPAFPKGLRLIKQEAQTRGNISSVTLDLEVERGKNLSESGFETVVGFATQAGLYRGIRIPVSF